MCSLGPGYGFCSVSLGNGQHRHNIVRDAVLSLQSMMIMRLGVVKPLETRKFIVVSRQYLGSTETEVIELWKSVMVRG